MNDLYFVCETCKIRVEAGYRWATSHLGHDAKIAEYGHLVDARDILNYKPFWTLPDGDEYNWLRKLLPIVRTFLECHEPHGIRFGDDVTFPESYFGFEWLDVSPSPDLVPRYFVEQMGFESWRQVCDYIDSNEHTPWWWNTDEHDHAKRTFERLIEKRRTTSG